MLFCVSGVVLKMARLVREGPHSIQGDSVKQAARNPPIRTYVISGKDFVQIVAKVSSCALVQMVLFMFV